MKNQACAAAAMAVLFFSIPIQSVAQQWPEKPVRILVPFPPGGGTDIQARLLSTAFQKSMGQNFLIENRTGASGLIATQATVDSPPDGYTILFTSGSIAPVTTLFARHIKFDMHKDLQPVSLLSSTPLVLSLHPSVPVKSVKELIALAKRTKGMNVGGNTAGTTAHLAAEMFNQRFGLSSTVVTFRGAGPAVISLISGEIDYIFATAPSIMPHIRSGRLKALAAVPAQRLPELPNVPTLAEQGFPGIGTNAWQGLFAPAATPGPVVDKIYTAVAAVLAREKTGLAEKMMTVDVSPSPAAFTAQVRRETQAWGEFLRDAKIKIE